MYYEKNDYWEPLKTTTKIKKPPPNGDFHNQAMKYPYFKL